MSSLFISSAAIPFSLSVFFAPRRGLLRPRRNTRASLSSSLPALAFVPFSVLQLRERHSVSPPLFDTRPQHRNPVLLIVSFIASPLFQRVLPVYLHFANSPLLSFPPIIPVHISSSSCPPLASHHHPFIRHSTTHHLLLLARAHSLILSLSLSFSPTFYA